MTQKQGQDGGSTRYNELKTMLEERRRIIQQEVQGRIQGVRAEGGDHRRIRQNPGETPETDIQDDIEFALIQMKAETLNKINEALSRLEEGRYGYCYDCKGEIAEARLRALPFAVRCLDCEERFAMQSQRAHAKAHRGSKGFLDLQR
ncbi:TraR/DksA family transcriptional regulator [Candidatus Nomurabacteria bacterium]|nr:TraR/DksA family transcriptional regulator [Candidatus Nomurabacteria bacterium]